jgi:serine/threonine-protein kinase
VGVVYKARDRNLGREVALKVLRSDRITVPKVAERLIEEAQVGGQLQHPGVVPVYALGLQKDGRPQFVMKLIKGATFAQLLQDRSGPEEDRPKFLSQFEQLCQTMAYCHARGVIHRDLKPANIMVGSFGEVLVVDWGFGKVLGIDARGRTKKQEDQTPGPESVIATLRSDAESGQSMVGSIMGTPAYMPPEQALGQVDDLDERADVFALGAVLCEILTGAPAYVGEPGDLIIMAAQGKLEDAFGRLDSCGADPALIDLAKDCMASVPSERPRDAGVISKRLGTHFSGLEERARRARMDAIKAHAHVEEQRARLAAERLRAEEERARVSRERIKSERARQSAEEQRRLNRWERQRRRRTMILSTVVMLALLVGGGVYAFTTSSAARRIEAQDTAFSNSFAAAMDHAAGHRWSEAITGANGSLSLLPPEDLDRRSYVEERIAEWKANKERSEAEATRQARDATMRERLRDLRASAVGGSDARPIDDGFAQAFRDYGIDLTQIPAAEAGQAIARSRISRELAEALDSWIVLRRENRVLKDRDWRKLLESAQEADSDPTRRRIRTELARSGNQALAHLSSSGGILEQPAHTLSQLARALLAVGDAPGALRLLRRAQERHPDDVWINLDLARALQSLRPVRWAEASRYLRIALALRPESQRIATMLGANLALAREWNTAAALWRARIVREPEESYSYGALSMALLRLGDVEGAQKQAEQMVAVELDGPGRWAAMDHLLGVLATRADTAAFLAKCEQVVDANPKHPGYLAYLALAQERCGHYEDAYATAEACLELDEEHPLASSVAAELKRRRGDDRGAVVVLQKAVDAMARSNVGAFLADPLHRELARSLEATGTIEENARELHRQHLGDPAALGPWWGLASVFRARLNYSEELRARRQIMRIDPFDVEALLELGELLRDRRARYAEAVAVLRRAVEVAPEAARAHSSLGRALVLAGEIEEGLRSCEQARRLDPLDSLVRRDQVAALLAANRAGEAQKVANQAAKDCPELCLALTAVGEAQLMVGELEGALATLGKAVDLAPANRQAQRLLARAHYRMGVLEAAEKLLAGATEQRARDALAKIALADARAAQGRADEALALYREVQRYASRAPAGYAGEAWLLGIRDAKGSVAPAATLRIAQFAVDLDPNDDRALRSFALASLRAGDPNSASTACAHVLTTPMLSASAAAETHLLLALAEARRGRLEQASAAFEQAAAFEKRADGPPGDRDALRSEAEALIRSGSEAK